MPEIKNVLTNRYERGSAWTRGQQSLDQLIQRVRQQLSVVPSPTSRHIRHARDPMIITCAAWQRQGKWIELFVNPSDTRWALPRRGTAVKTQAGVVRNTWRNRYRGTYYDEATVGITFQTGNIMPFMGYPESIDLQSLDDVARAIANPKVPPGLLNFYRFLELLDQPMLWGAGENRHIVLHHSRVFPELLMEGYFVEDGPTFSEVVTDGNRLQWEATFQIYRTAPRLSDSVWMANTYMDFIDRAGRDEAYGPENVAGYLYGSLNTDDLPGTFPKTGPNAVGAPTRFATSPQKTQNIADRQAAAAASKVSPRTRLILGG